MILCKISLYIPNVSILISDYKNSLIFKPFRNCKNYYGGENAVTGIIDFYNELKERITTQDEERKKQVKVLILDEYSSIIDEYDKEYDLKKKVAYILNMGREYNMRIVVGMQRADSEFFKSGSRDNFRAKIALGNISAEQTKMLGLDKSKMTDITSFAGEGYLHLDGLDNNIEQIKVTKIDDLSSVIEYIKEAMER